MKKIIPVFMFTIMILIFPVYAVVAGYYEIPTFMNNIKILENRILIIFLIETIISIITIFLYILLDEKKYKLINITIVLELLISIYLYIIFIKYDISFLVAIQQRLLISGIEILFIVFTVILILLNKKYKENTLFKVTSWIIIVLFILVNVPIFYYLENKYNYYMDYYNNYQSDVKMPKNLKIEPHM